MKNVISAILVAVAVCVAMTGCQQEPTYRIGVSQCSSDDWRNKMNDEIRREIMFHPEASVEIRSADDDNAKQIEDIRYFMDNDFDIIIAAPNEEAPITPIIDEAYGKGIPVIVFDRNILSDSYTARIAVDNVALGTNAAHYAHHMLGDKWKAIEIYGLKGSTPAEERHKGFKAYADEHPGIELVGSGYGDWNQDDAERVVDSMLRVHPDVNLIYAHNDRMAIGASKVAEKHGRKDIKIIGIDAAPEIGIQAVADSVIDATFLYPTEGHKIIRTALAILKGEPVDRDIYLPLASAVDASNADILLLQNESLQEETSKIRLLKEQVDLFWERHNVQTMLFYAVGLILVLAVVTIFLILRAFWQRKRHQLLLEKQNKLLEEERDKQKQLNEQLAEATQSKLMFFTNVSHDLRTPLTLISEPVEQLSEAKNLTEQQSSLVKIANKNVKILKRLINQILDFRKYENGKLNLHLSEINLGKLVTDWADAFKAIAKKRDIKLTVSAEQPEGLTMAADVEKMERVFFNLVSNAFKYTPDNGSIAITYKADETKASLSVTDSGIGISPEDIGNRFDRFFQVDKVHPKGSGIGLSLAKAFVELHGGTIEAQSTEGKGSTFTVTIPVTHVENTAPVTPPAITEGDIIAELETIPEEKASATGETDKPLLLVIDDNEDIRQLVGQLMADSYNVITAPNGAEGLRLAAKYVPDIVVCDVMMPVMDGMECCRRMKEEVTTSHIPVLMLTACSMDEQKVEGYNSGADGYVAKPFNSSLLRARCASLVANRRRIKEVLGASSPVASASKPEPTATPTPTAGSIDSEFYRKFLEILEKEIGNPDTNVDSLAGKMGLGRSQFYRKIKALTNYSPVEILRNLRLKKAREMLTRTERTISEIAYDTGFSTPAYFTKCFREAYGETPSELRDRIAGKS